MKKLGMASLIVLGLWSVGSLSRYQGQGSGGGFDERLRSVTCFVSPSVSRRAEFSLSINDDGWVNGSIIVNSQFRQLQWEEKYSPRRSATLRAFLEANCQRSSTNIKPGTEAVKVSVSNSQGHEHSYYLQERSLKVSEYLLNNPLWDRQYQRMLSDLSDFQIHRIGTKEIVFPVSEEVLSTICETPVGRSQAISAVAFYKDHLDKVFEHRSGRQPHDCLFLRPR